MRRTQRPAAAANTNLETLSSGSRLGNLIFDLCLLYHWTIAGAWHVVVQTEGIQQRVAVDMCHHPDLPCPGLADCGRKSRCVQRYNYQLLLSLPASHAPAPALAPACPAVVRNCPGTSMVKF